MNILIAYATYSSGTLNATQYLSNVLSELNHSVIHKNITNVTSEEFINVDLVILASPSWLINSKDGQPHQDILEFMETNKLKIFDNTRFAIMGLGDMSYAHFCGAVDVITSFINSIKGNIITEPLRIDGYYFDQENNNARIKEWAEKIHQYL